MSVSGVCGEAPPEQLKVCVNTLGGFRNTMELVLTGLDLDAKADWVRSQLEGRLTAASVTWTRTAEPHVDAETEEGASCLLRVTAMDDEAGPVGKAFTGPLVELALGSYPGFTMTSPPGAAHAVRRLPRRPTCRATPSPTRWCTPTGAARRCPSRRRSPTVTRRRRPPSLALPGADGLAHPARAARHVRARPLR